MALNDKFSDVYDRILSLKDEVVSISSRLESGGLEDDALKRGLVTLENQQFAQNRKLEIASLNSKKHCLNLEAEALAQSTGLRRPAVLRDAHIEAVKKEKSALQEDIRKMRNKKKELLARLHSLNLEADKLNSDEEGNKETPSEEDSEQADFAALLAELEAAQEKDAFLRKSFEETATVLLRDQNDIRHILEDLTKWIKKGEASRRTLETGDLMSSEVDRNVEIVEEVSKEPSAVVSKSKSTKLKISQYEKEIEEKCNQLRVAMEDVNKLLEMERQGSEKIIDCVGPKLEDDSSNKGT